MTEKQVAYYVALDLVDEIDVFIKRGYHHYRDGAGNLFHSLDQVIRAILNNEWPPEDQDETMPKSTPS